MYACGAPNHASPAVSACGLTAPPVRKDRPVAASARVS